jgi:phage gpG-like protein
MATGLAADLRGDDVPRMLGMLPKEYKKAQAKALRKGGQQVAKFWKLRLSGPRSRTRLGVVSGSLRRSITVGRVQPNGTIAIGTALPYARVHEFGVDDLVHVSQHQRRHKSGTTHTVSQHARRMRLPKRPHRKPAVRDVRRIIPLIFRGETDAAIALSKKKAGRIKSAQLKLAGMA